MSLRKMLTTTGVALGAGALALSAAPANAAPIMDLVVSSTDASGPLKDTASVTMPVYGSPTNLTCSTGSVAGTWTGGDATFTGLSLSGCSSFIPGTTVTLSLNSALKFTADRPGNVTATKTDTNVTGVISGASNAVKVTVSGGCTATLGGTSNASFNEATDELTLSGPGFTVSSASGLCLGSISSGNTLTMNGVTFTLGGGANFVP